MKKKRIAARERWECMLRYVPPAWQTMRRFKVSFRDGTEIEVDYLFPGVNYPAEGLDHTFWSVFEFHGKAISETGYHSGWSYSPTILSLKDLQFLPSTPEEYVTPILSRLCSEREKVQQRGKRKKGVDPRPARALACYTFLCDYKKFEDHFSDELRAYRANLELIGAQDEAEAARDPDPEPVPEATGIIQQSEPQTLPVQMTMWS